MKHSKILILGRSGSGKSFSLHSLDPKTTGIINIDKKELSFGHPDGYKLIMNGDGRPDLDKSNYVETDRMASVQRTLDTWAKRDDLKTIVIDTLTHLITSDYVNNAIGKDFKSYQRMGLDFWHKLDTIRNMDKNVIALAHIEEKFNDSGERVFDMKSQGNMIRNFEPESYFTTMLFSEPFSTEEGVEYRLKTAPTSTFEKIKSPAKYVDGKLVRALEPYEPNDAKLILDKLSNF